jgi:molecular chaperone HscB
MSAAPPITVDYFTFFSLPRKLSLDISELQRRFYELSRQLHPDRFAGRSAQEQQYALDATALLNDAYRVLRDPVARAEYLLKLEGFDIGEQRSKDVPPELLEEVFELNMMLEELRGGDESTRPQLEQERTRFLDLLRAVDDNLAKESTRFDQGGDGASLNAIRGVLNRRRYIQNLVREVERALAGEAPAIGH